MIEIPSRISALIERVERGDDPTPEELRRIQLLQAFDLAKAGEDYARQAMEREERRTEEFRQLLEG
jgi:hypothetical protein